MAIGNGVLREIGVHTGRSYADQDRKIVRVDTLRRTDRNRTEASETLRHEVRVNRACRQDHRNRHVRIALSLVGENDMLSSGANRIFGFLADPCERILQSLPVACRIF